MNSKQSLSFLRFSMQAFAVMQDFAEAVQAAEKALKASEATEGHGRASIVAALQLWQSCAAQRKEAAHSRVHKAFMQRAAGLLSGRIQARI